MEGMSEDCWKEDFYWDACSIAAACSAAKTWILIFRMLRVVRALRANELLLQEKGRTQWKGNSAEVNKAPHKSVRQTVNESWKGTWQKAACVFLG